MKPADDSDGCVVMHEENGFSYLKDFEAPRRSQRKRRFKDELQIKVCSTDRLKEVKFKVRHLFHFKTN